MRIEKRSSGDKRLSVAGAVAGAGRGARGRAPKAAGKRSIYVLHRGHRGAHGPEVTASVFRRHGCEGLLKHGVRLRLGLSPVRVHVIEHVAEALLDRVEHRRAEQRGNMQRSGLVQL